MSNLETKKLQLAEKWINEKKELSDLKEVMGADFLKDQLHTKEGFFAGLGDTIKDKLLLQKGGEVATSILPQLGILSAEQITSGQKIIAKYKEELKNLSESHVDQELENTQVTERILDDEEDVADNESYDIATFATPAMQKHISDYITKLPAFTSVGFLRDPETKTTLCSRTARLDMEKLFGVKIPSGNAFDAMRQEDAGFNYSIVSQLYKDKETATSQVDQTSTQDQMATSEYISQIAGDNNVADLYVTSSTIKGRTYGHRATMFRVDDQWFVIDPYTMVQPGEQKNKPRTLESYATSMKNGRNKREFMRMNFYDSHKIDATIAHIKEDIDDVEKMAA